VMSILLFNLLPLMIFGGVGFVIYLVAMNNIDSGAVKFYLGHAKITYLMTTPYIYLGKNSYVLPRGYWYYDGLFNKDAIYKFYHISNQVISAERVKSASNLGGKKAKISVKSKAKPKTKRKANTKSRNVN
jgi:Trk-type K+ transport system membrane component